MSKKNRMVRKRKQRKDFPWLFAVLGGGLLILTAILLRGVANRVEEQPPSRWSQPGSITGL